MMLKVCGARTAGDVALLARLGVDLVGLWHGTGGPAELSLERLAGLAERARAEGVVPVLVTFLADPAVLAQVLAVSGVEWVQLHGYQPPALVRALSGEGRMIVKALHVRGRECQERPLLPAYARAGVDFFLLDAVSDDGRLGSTGRRLDPAAVAELGDALTVPFLLAGGLTADDPAPSPAGDPVDPRPVGFPRHSLMAGVDVDHGARDERGHLDPVRVAALRRWTAKEPA
ncbi:N-(5'-phosphoribosyl)anthranilate isomerase [Spongiactinospora sp. 9N601]|uniref:phosphoribosylanthranilate isomerase n=1 Tax=Spongiactinospora sp. 9N601 TaxID=3375149 RepID=UPI00379C2F50